MNEQTEMKNIIERLNKWSYEYYTLGKPSVSDTTYDGLYDKLVKLEEETGIILSSSPTQKVGNETLSNLTKVKHEYPLLSLDKVKEKDISKLYKFIKNNDVVAMLKMDGLTIDITYDNGKLTRAETRGNGEIGEDITHNIKHFTNVPLTIPYKNHVHIIGEAILTYSQFNLINSKLPKDKQYKNPRNLVSGTVRQLDSSICKEREPMFVGYIVEGNNELKTKLEQIEFIQKQGFESIPCIQFKDGISEYNLNTFIDKLKDTAKLKDYPIDGLVFMYNDIEYGKSLGNTLHHPLHSLALKFNEDSELTRITNVIWQSGRTNVLTPVAEFEPIELCGTTVKRATLDNISQIEKLKLGIGDEVSVIKANEIIPKIIDNITQSNTLEIPKICPQCGSKTEIRVSDSGIKSLYCTNDKCSLVQKIVHYCSRNAMNIVGLSKETIRKFIQLGLINKIEDIYTLHEHKEYLYTLDGFGKKSIDKLLQSIENSKICKLENFIFALGIPNVGIQTAKDIVKFVSDEFTYYSEDVEHKISQLDYNSWLNMCNCGSVLAQSIYNYFHNDINKYQYFNLLEILNIQHENASQNNSNGIFKDMKIYATGTFANYKKNELKQIIEEQGGTFANGFAKSLDLLIVGSVKGSSKVQKAIDCGIKVMEENEFTKLIKRE